jgi:hypothetical protein
VHFRTTAAHNPISVDGRDQARHVSKMAWTHTYTPLLEGASADGALGWARGSHDGYADSGRGVVHRRSVWLRPGGYVVIFDELTGAAGRMARANFQFAPGELQLEGADGAVFDRRFELCWACSTKVTAEVIRDGDSPSGGWIAPSLGVRVRAPRLLLEFPIEQGRVALLTVLADRQRSAAKGLRRVHFMRLAEMPTARTVVVRIDGDVWEDHLMAGAGGSPVRWSGVESDAPLAVAHVVQGSIVDTHRMGGRFARVLEPDPAPAPRERAFLSGAKG